MGDIHNSLKYIYEYIRFAEWELVRIKSLGHPQDAIRNSIHKSREIVENHGGHLSQNLLLDEHNTDWSFAHLAHSFPERSGLNEKIVPPEDGERNLLISGGFAVGCFDLNRCGDDPFEEIHHGVIISTLQLIGGGFPISMGLFRLGPRVYMIGGQDLPGLNKNPTSLWDLQALDCIYLGFPARASSRDTYSLSRADDDTLSLSRCDFIPPLNKPKLWPIVEKIGNQLHVIESFPLNLFSHVPKDTIASHEVLNLDDLRPGWREISPMCADEVEVPGGYIANHIVVGHRIYAVTYNSSPGLYMVFDTETGKWKEELHLHHQPGFPFNFSVKHVAQTLVIGCAHVAQTLELTGMHVVIVLREDENSEMVMVAYLVQQGTGQVVCFQLVRKFYNKFYDKFKRRIYGLEGRIIKVDDEGKTLCAIFEGETPGTDDSFIFIATFTVDVDVHALGSNSIDDDAGTVPERDFVKVVIKDFYVYKKSEDDPEARIKSCSDAGYGACFL